MTTMLSSLETTGRASSRDRTRLLVAGLLGLVAALLMAALVRQELALGGGRLVAVGGIVFIVAAGFAYVLYPLLFQLGRVRLALLVVALLLALGVTRPWAVPGTLPAPRLDATLGYPGGERQSAIPGRLSAWGRQVAGFAMQPADGSGRAPDAISLAFPSPPASLDVLFSRPREALLGPDDEPRASDGVAVEMTVVPVDGQASTDRFELPHAAFLADRWVTRTVGAASGIARIDIRIHPRGTPDRDALLVGFAEPAPLVGLHRMGKWGFVTWVFFCLALYLCVSIRDDQIGRTVRRGRLLIGRHGVPLLVAVVLIGLTWYVALRTTYVFFWDFRNYWYKTEVLHDLIVRQAWPQFLDTVLGSMRSEYSMLPAILPAFVEAAIGRDSRVAYTVLLAVLYAAPAYLMIMVLGQRLLVPAAASRVRGRIPAVGFLCVLFGLPLFFSTVLWLMPDIGGVVLFVGALLYADGLLRSLSAPTAGSGGVLSADMVRNTLGLALCLSLMFLFRRWFVFASAGVVLTMAGVGAWVMWKQRRCAGTLALRGLVVFFLGSSVALAFLAPVLLEWSRNLGGHDYAALYAGYKDPLSTDLQRFLNFIGAGALVACIGGAIAGYRRGGNRTLWVLLTGSTAVACALFLKVQSPARHHYYLLMPFLGASLYMLAVTLMRRWGTRAGLVLLALLVAGNIAATGRGAGGDWRDVAFPGYNDWLPKKQPHLNGFRSMVRWLNDPANAGRICVIASGATINESVFYELWQVIPSIDRGAWQQRWIGLGQVDTIHGPPSSRLRECQIALVATPFQHHLRPSEQYSLEILQQDLLAGSGIGAAWQRASEVFDMGQGVEVIPFRRVRPISDEEYEDVVQRFLRAKGPGYVSPMQK